MRLGKTLSCAMEINECKVAALWLFARKIEASNAARLSLQTDCGLPVIVLLPPLAARAEPR
eukprot:11650092-Heterocapsa_arctica.AAC.1